jgi:4-amino-4-deoxy-L-arabinose transferase-like glycosyltransferase
MERKALLLLGIIAALSAAARIIYLLRLEYFYWDEAIYLAMADAFAGRFYVFEYFRPPLWSALLSLFPTTALTGKAVSLGVSLLTIPLIYWLARKGLGERKALLISFLYAFNHFSMYFAGFATTESLSVMLLFVSFLAFYNASEGKRMPYWALAGASYGLAAMTKHMALFMVFPMIAYLYYKDRVRQGKGLTLMLLSALAVLLPWLAWMKLLFGNALYPQMANFGTSTYESPLFYLESLPFFLGIQGILIAFSIPRIRKDRFAILSMIVVLAGLGLLCVVGHKETRYLMVLLPGIVSLEAIGMDRLAERFRDVRAFLPHIMVASGTLAVLYAFAFAPYMPPDTELESCMELAAPYHADGMMSTAAPFLAFEDRKPAIQMPWEPGTLSCEDLRSMGIGYVMYQDDWHYSELRGEFLEAAGSCIEAVAEEEGCTIYRVS